MNAGEGWSTGREGYMPDDAVTPGATGGSRALEGGDDRVIPVDLKVNIAGQRLTVTWKDGSHSECSLAELRRVCPCATCRSDRSRQAENPLTVLRADPTGVRVTAARLVGRYAIEFEWSDGHKAGIFNFRMLRSLAEG